MSNGNTAVRHPFYFRSGGEEIHPVSGDWPADWTPDDLYGALLHVWCRETCAPRLRTRWSEADPTVGQCSVTAFLAQDIFGGDVFGVPLPDGGIHCYNAVRGSVFDLTDAQFLPEKLEYPCLHPQDRAVHFAKEEKRNRYICLSDRLKQFCSGRGMNESKEDLSPLGEER